MICMLQRGTVLVSSAKHHAFSCGPGTAAMVNRLRLLQCCFSSSTDKTTVSNEKIRLSKLLAVNLGISRREAERCIRQGSVTFNGQPIQSPQSVISRDDIMDKSPRLRFKGKPVLVQNIDVDEYAVASTTSVTSETSSVNNQVWLAHKLAGELVSDFDPQGRPCLMERLKRDGLGSKTKRRHHGRLHWKPIGRLDMNTEGLVVITHSGSYAREMELPQNQLHRTYRVRVHGLLNQYKLDRLQRGNIVTDDGIRYSPMRVRIDPVMTERQKKRTTSTNTWLQITCTEGKNRQVRNALQVLGLTVTRLIRISYGDYELQTIPPGMAIPVSIKPLDRHKRRGPLFVRRHNPKVEVTRRKSSGLVQWKRVQ